MPNSTRARSVLLVGAYANGNIGDTYQAEAIASELAAIDPTLKVSSVSPSKLAAPYPSRNHQALPASVLWDADHLNSFDLILVGGGGLLAAPHHPLNDVSWVEQITTRLCGLSLGVAADPVLASRAFVERCDLFSVRDEFSASHVAAMRKDVVIVPDPILLGGQVDVVGGAVPAERRRGVACISGKHVPATVNVWQRLEQELLTSPNDPVISVNPVTDRRSGFDETFLRKVSYIPSVVALSQQLLRRRFVVSERYHGCIFALKWGIPVYGIALRSADVTSKITELFRWLELDDFLIRPDSQFRRPSLARKADEAFDFAAIHSRLEGERDRLRAYLRQCLAA